MRHMRRRDFVAGTFAATILSVACRSSSDGSDSSEPIGPNLAPAALAARLGDVSGGKIAVLYVGPPALFARGHVPGAKNIGEVSTADGRGALAAAVAALAPETEVVLYCGCCPLKNCPNVRPASAFIRGSGRKNAHVLDLPTRFATDWADKGYPVERA
jgi:thiosulfate/3-mercaptopyruvate sulfurtransferase